MIISKAYAGKLLREGKALVLRFHPDGTELAPAKNLKGVDKFASVVRRENGSRWVMVTRFDNYRIDHYPIG